MFELGRGIEHLVPVELPTETMYSKIGLFHVKVSSLAFSPNAIFIPRNPEDLLAKEYRAAMLKRMTEGYVVASGSLIAGFANDPGNGSEDDGDEDDDDDDDDGGFLGEYRQRRLEQLKATAGRPEFGQIVEAERATFVKAVDTEDPRTNVVVHLYEPYIGACRRMNRFLEVRGYPFLWRGGVSGWRVSGQVDNVGCKGGGGKMVCRWSSHLGGRVSHT